MVLVILWWLISCVNLAGLWDVRYLVKYYSGCYIGCCIWVGNIVLWYWNHFVTLWDCSMPGFPVLQYLPECSNSYPLSWWCHSTISSSVILFSFCLQSFPVLGYFPMSQLLASGSQSIRASASVLPKNIQGWFPLRLTLFDVQRDSSRVFSSTTVQKHHFFGTLLSFGLPS